MIPVSNFSDQELSIQLRNGDNSAFTEIYNRYWQCLYKVSYSVLKDSDACDDIVQEIFVWLWLNREKQYTDSFKAYLYAAVKYKVANVIRHGKIKETFFTYALDTYIEAVNDENCIEVQELKAIIINFTENLPERARIIFHLSRNEYLSNREIAKSLGITEKTVENQMNISLKKLRISLGKMSFWSFLI